MGTALSLPAWLMAPPQFGAARMAHVRYRTRLLALMGAAVTIGLLPNELFLGHRIDFPLMVAFRTAMALALFFAALAVRRARQTTAASLSGTLGVFLLFLADLFLFPLGLLHRPPAALATAYTVTPIALIGISGIFPLALAEGVVLIAVVGTFFGGGLAAGLIPAGFDLGQAAWSAALLGLAVLWMQRVTLRSLAECDFSIRTDPLSGTFNRRATDEAGTAAVGGRYGLAVLFIDIDHFKPLNDRYGHACGDQVIRHLAQVLLENSRGEDIVGRIGGEEFLFLAPRTRLQGAKQIAGRIRRTLRQLPASCEEREVPFTVSIGIAEARQGETFGEVVKRADRAMYAAKQAGRDRVMTAPTAPGAPAEAVAEPD
ncbi:MAG TPA: diguanylate cyclase [Gammaproteobacteria bacterium]|nr:diguanylate cyclase [Gammaproteobacteria bacterium]